MKIDDFHNHVNQDSELFRVLRFLPRAQEDGPWLAGGSVWKAIENRPITHDLDFFFQNQAQCAQWIRTLNSIPYVHHIVGEKENRYNRTYQFHVHDKGYNKTVSVQCIHFKFWNSLQELLEGFDFTACQFGFDGRKLFTGDTAFDDVRDRVIRFNKVHDSVATGIHLDKYVKQGFKIPASEQQKFDEIVKAMNEKRNQPVSVVSTTDDDAYPRPEAVREATRVISQTNTLLATFDSFFNTNSTATTSLW